MNKGVVIALLVGYGLYTAVSAYQQNQLAAEWPKAVAVGDDTLMLSGVGLTRRNDDPLVGFVIFDVADAIAAQTGFPFLDACNAVLHDAVTAPFLQGGNPEIVIVGARSTQKRMLIFTSTQEARHTFEVRDGTCVGDTDTETSA